MTTSTPPGWYPEPGHTGNSPAMERWWDGSAWTEYTRTAPVPPTAPPPYPSYPQAGYGGPAPDTGRRTGTVVIALVASLVLIGAVVAGILVLGKDDNGKDDAKGTPTPSHSAGKLPQPQPSDRGDDGGSDGGGSTGGDGGSDGSGGDPTKAIDAADAISLPVLDGWQGQSGVTAAAASVSPYNCPGTQQPNCTLGGVNVRSAEAAGLTATTPRAAAEQDIAPNAAESYGQDTYGKTTSHQQIKAGAVTVAGQQGYLVRWRVVTESGTQGYVESLVFTSPTSKHLVVVRFGFDITAKAPTLADMDKITQGIKTDTSLSDGASAGTGV